MNEEPLFHSLPSYLHSLLEALALEYDPGGDLVRWRESEYYRIPLSSFSPDEFPDLPASPARENGYLYVGDSPAGGIVWAVVDHPLEGEEIVETVKAESL